MAVQVNRNLLRYHSLLHLRLTHAAIGNYPMRGRNALPVNRMLMIFQDSGGSSIHDLRTDKLFNMRAGNIYFIPCYHEIAQSMTEKLLFVSFQFNLDIYYGFDIFRDYGKCVEINASELISEARELVRSEVDTKLICRINEIIYNLCLSLLSGESGEIKSKRITANEYASVLDFVENYGDATTTVAELAKRCGMRQDVFSRKFSHDMGISPKDFITRSLIRKATELLLRPGVTIQNVADTLNFSSENYFYRFFKRNTSTTPRAFRKINGMYANN